MAAYGNCRKDKHALEVFNSIPDDKKDVVSVGAMMKVFVNNNRNKDAFNLYDQYKSMHNHVMELLAIKACINLNDTQRATILTEKALHKEQDANNIRVINALIGMYGHFKDTAKALELWRSINVENRNSVCNGCIMHVLIVESIIYCTPK